MTAYTMVADTSEESKEQTPDTKPVWPNPFAIRPMADLRAFVMNRCDGRPVEPISEVPSAEVLRFLADKVMNLPAERIAQVLKMPKGVVADWLNPESGMRPCPQSFGYEVPDWTWVCFLRFWALGLWWAAEQGIEVPGTSAGGDSGAGQAEVG